MIRQVKFQYEFSHCVAGRGFIGFNTLRDLQNEVRQIKCVNVMDAPFGNFDFAQTKPPCYWTEFDFFFFLYRFSCLHCIIFSITVRIVAYSNITVFGCLPLYIEY